MACLDDCEATYQADEAAAWQRHTARLLNCATNECRISSAEQLNADRKANADRALQCEINCFLNQQGGPPDGGS